MPRIRDLGISFIPSAADDVIRYQACEGDVSCTDLSACDQDSVHPCDESPDAANSCSEGTAQCLPHSNEPERETRGLGPEAIAQLRQHLHARLGTQLPY
jgi:hypothetical protein